MWPHGAIFRDCSDYPTRAGIEPFPYHLDAHHDDGVAREARRNRFEIRDFAAEEGYLGIDYTPDLIIIQVTWLGLASSPMSAIDLLGQQETSRETRLCLKFPVSRWDAPLC
jgi:hypothetical protein